MFNNQSSSPWRSGASHHSPNSNWQNPGEFFNPEAQDAVLYLFSPRKMGDQVMRPFVYNFSDRFISGVSDAITSSNPENVNAKVSTGRLIADHRLLAESMAPALKGTENALSQLSDYWTFLLIVPDDRAYTKTALGTSEILADAARLHGSKVIYYGFCFDEPVNPRTMNSGSPTVNPDAALNITHKTVLNSSRSYGASGVGKMRTDLIGNADFIDPGLLKSSIPDKQIYRALPGDIIDTVYIGNDPATNTNYVYDAASSSLELSPNGRRYAVNNLWADPKAHLTALLDGYVAAENTVVSSRRLGSISNAAFDWAGTDVNEDVFTATLQNVWKNAGGTVNAVGMNADEFVTIGAIVSRYDPIIQPVKVENSIMYSPADQRNATPKNMFSSMIMAAAPTILVNSMLLDVSFEYDSHHDQILNVFNIGHVSSTSDEEKSKAFIKFCAAMRDRLFYVIKAIRGDFRLHLSLQGTGISTCVLNFYDEHDLDPTPYEVPTIAGGLNTTSIAENEVMTHNGSTLSGLSQSLTAVGSDYYETEMAY